MSNTLVQFLLLVTIFLLSASVLVVQRIRDTTKKEGLKLAWAALGGFLFLSGMGCFGFLYTNQTEGAGHYEDSLIACTLLASAVFVLGVCFVSLLTAKDLARIDGLERAAFFDPLTRLFTRGRIDTLLDIECERSRFGVTQLSVLLLDIDNFKTINDTLGHRAGDSVLEEVGRILKKAVEPPNVIGRYGGEEFLIVAPNTSSALAERHAENIRAKVARATVKVEGKVVPLTVSIGVASNSVFRRGSSDLVAAADTAMYAAKQRGRNRVVIADELDEPITRLRKTYA
ncbi:GGDEF domain-containing protein [Terriglobus roseus]|uniref:diguanylate cyclase n=1 Tax=Terriglobus roseus TaxID=392734 RepID=A0A1H4M3F5_9BACT|nr:GGDEF domain-containing protein [Terriglobus roseus]SEB77035.1 diguanylate cyclase (GGDEF) domain-containing protein [Terriglobus roseus]